VPRLAAGDAHPVAAEPDAVPRDDGLAGAKRLAPRNRIGQRFDGQDALEQTRNDGRALDARGQRSGRCRRACLAACFGDRELAGAQRVDRLGNSFDAVDADGLQVAAQRGLDGALPALVDLELLRKPRPRIQAAARKPFRGAGLALAERRLLHGFDRQEFTARGLELGLCGVQRGRSFALRVAQRLQR
jgi:hypothetical protein